jgi:hydroxymethylglutaryl-CoA lyase
VPSSTKVEFISKLSQTGLSVVEATAFVSPKWVPQMADHSQVFTSITKLGNNSINYPVLVPNMKGIQNFVFNFSHCFDFYIHCFELLFQTLN